MNLVTCGQMRVTTTVAEGSPRPFLVSVFVERMYTTSPRVGDECDDIMTKVCSNLN